MTIFKQLRLKHKFSQAQLAALVNVHQTAVSQWELGKSTPDIEVLKKLSELYGVSIDYLVGREETGQVEQDEVDEILEALHKRPEMKTLFSISQKSYQGRHRNCHEDYRSFEAGF